MKDGCRSVAEKPRRPFGRAQTRHPFPLGIALSGALLTASCASVPRTPYTAEQARKADVPIAGVRTFGDFPSPAFERDATSVISRQAAPTYLALSGGAGDGAYGAGILNGWTRSGRRPNFTIVSGVSTGALIAPFAFLGADYDGVLKEIYTSGVAETLLSNPSIINALTGSSIFSDERFSELIARYVTPEIIAEIARETDKGRLLLVLTTNLDSQRPVIWNMGAIARQGDAAAIALFRQVLRASAAIPAVFPPALIDVAADGQAFQELHVDGSISSNVYTLPRSYLNRGSGNRASVRNGRMFVILNTVALPQFDVTENKTTSILGKTISVGFSQQVRSDLRATYDASKATGFAFNVTSIRPEDLEGRSASEGQTGFDTARMRYLYDLGERRGATGSFWVTQPPSVADTPASR